MSEPLVTTSGQEQGNDEQVALQLHAINKVYRLYRRPMYRVLDLFGLCPPGDAFYSEHIALQNIDLSINRGEKVAIIGRNGAGKSTLLKTITGVLRPTNGKLEVKGRINALLQIGTGFHPDFTGRQNAYSSMAHQGITGRQADEKFEEIVDFAELEEFIDQPMKTYSTGMGARLMFSAAVVIEPDILIVDEVLGVGDAYFTHKSFQKMRDLCAAHGTTLLLVSHDIYSAMNLCDRFIWIDKGQVKFDGDGKTAIARYEASVKAQEEERLRKRGVRVLDRRASAPAATRLQVLIRSRTGFALPAPLALARIEVLYADGRALALDVAQGDAAWALMDESNLGPPREVDGKAARVIEPLGSIYHKAEWSLALPDDQPLKELKITWHYGGDDPAQLRVITDTKQVLVKDELGRTRGWETKAYSLAGAVAGELDPVHQTEFGTGAVRMTRVELLGRDGLPVSKVEHGGFLQVRVHCEVADTLMDRAATFFVGFNRPGFPYGGYTAANRIEFAPGRRHFVLNTTLHPLIYGSGSWMISVAFGEANLYHRKDLSYFTISDKWYHFLARGLELEIETVDQLDANGCFVVHPAAFQLEADVEVSSPDQYQTA